MQIPCIPCDPDSHLHSVPDNLSLHDISIVWSHLNANLQSNLVAHYNAYPIPGNLADECGPHLAWFHYHHRHCALALLGIRHNFTHISTTLYYSQQKKFAGRLLNTLSFGMIGTSSSTVDHFFPTRPTNTKHVWHIFGNEFYDFKFATVTKYWRTLRGPEELTAPLDLPTWTSLLISIAGILALLRLKLGESFENSVFWIFSTIMNQGSDDISITSSKSTLVWITCWHFACLLLNTFYQGEVSPSLTAKFPPSVPLTMNELLNSGLSILTTSTISMSKDGMSHVASEIIESIIPEYMDSLEDDNAQVFQSMKKLREQLVFATSGSSYKNFGSITSNISDSLQVTLTDHKARLDTSENIAILDYTVDLEHFIQAIELLGKRVVVRNHATIPFLLIIPVISQKNFISQRFSKTLSALEESGIYLRWLNLYELGLELRIVKDTIRNGSVHFFTQQFSPHNFHSTILTPHQFSLHNSHSPILTVYHSHPTIFTLQFSPPNSQPISAIKIIFVHTVSYHKIIIQPQGGCIYTLSTLYQILKP
ncbi:hypothetical protein Fcan01_01379 [Folsomia candida]|uniref:Uncharacterized protein n=1 Tax=Folsomia candida TaxID=158441 RepID=A0A226F036_FOLCA|nr:hypothetical protein Fcan01_01379 [Folsomia candida]